MNHFLLSHYRQNLFSSTPYKTVPHFQGVIQGASIDAAQGTSINEEAEACQSTDFSELLLKLRANDAQAWLTLQRQYIPLARGYAKAVSQFSRIPKSELSEAAEFGLLKGIGEMRKPSFDIWKTGVVDFLKIHIREAVSEVLKTQRPELSLNENWGDDTGFFNPLEPLSREQNPAQAATEAISSEETDTPLGKFSPENVYPALGVVESWLLRTHPELTPNKGLSEAQLSKKLGLSEKFTHRLRLKVRAKARARVRHSKLNRQEREGRQQPYPHLKALDRLALEKSILIPVFGDSMGFFTPHQQKVLQLMGHFEMTPKQVAKTLQCTEDALSHLAIEIVKKMDDLLKQKLMPEEALQFQRPTTPLEALTKILTLECKLSGLSEKDLLRLTFAERTLLQKAYLEKTPLAPEEETRITGIMTQLAVLTGQSPRQFRETVLNPLTPALAHLAALNPVAAQLVVGTIGQGQSLKEVARTLPKVTSLKAKGELKQAKVDLRQAMSSGKTTPPPVPSNPEESTQSKETEFLCEALLKEGLEGLTPSILNRVLTPYQHQMLTLRAQGKSYAEIATASELGLSPVKAAVTQGIQALKKELKRVDFKTLMAEAGLPGFTSDDQRAFSPQVVRLFRQYFMEGHTLSRWEKPDPNVQVGVQLNSDVLQAIEALPEKQKEILLDFVSQDISFSELARQRNTILTGMTSMVKAALINIEKTLNPFSLHHWITEQGIEDVTKALFEEAISADSQKLLRLLAKKELHLAATVSEMPKNMPVMEKLKRLNSVLEAAWQGIDLETQRLINIMANGDYVVSALNSANGPQAARTGGKELYRDKVSPALNRVFKQVGAASLGTLLKLNGFDYVSEGPCFERLTPESKAILSYYLAEGKDLKPLANRIQKIALGDLDAAHWLQLEVDRGYALLTPYQKEIWTTFSQNKYNAAEVARKIGKSQKAVAAALRLMINKLETVWQQDSLLMALSRQGLVELRQPEQLAVFGQLVSTVLDKYIEKGYSIEPFLKALKKAKPNLPIEHQLVALKQAVENAIDGLSSDLQKNILKGYASGVYLNYEAIAVAVGLNPQDRNRIGTTIDAALKNLRVSLENAPQTLLEH